MLADLLEHIILRKIVSLDEVDDGTQASNALIRAIRTLLESEKDGSSTRTAVKSRNDGAEIVRPWLGSEHEVQSSGGGRTSNGRVGGQRSGRGGRGRGRSRGRGGGRGR